MAKTTNTENHTVVLTDGSAKYVNNGQPLNGEYTVQIVGTFNGSVIEIQTTLDTDLSYLPITDSGLSNIQFIEDSVMNVKLNGFVRAIPVSGTPTSVSVLFSGV